VALASVVMIWLRALTGKADLSMMVTRQGRSDAAAQQLIGSFIEDATLRAAFESTGAVPTTPSVHWP
jgi:hypothetical protein